MKSRFVQILLLAVLACSSITLAAEAAVKLQPAFQNLTIERPVAVVVPPDGTKRLFLAQQRGQVRILPKDESGAEARMFLDLSDRALEANQQSKFEEGLNGLVFHPKFAQNGKFYVFYTQQDPKRARLSEMRVSKNDPDKADPATERVLLEVLLPFWNHHSGNLVFGADGLLYFTIGDGGGKPGGDPLNWAQNLFVLNAKVLRIDVDGKTGAREYGIPQDNPYVGKEAARPEVYANGLRNPWGLSFDADGALWCADVGQDLYEEINLIEKGGNYGWSFREGMQKFPPRAAQEPPPGTVFVDPIFVYDRTQGLSITGGFVYRGSKLPSLKGAYIYGDWAFGRIWALKYDKAAKKVISNETLHQPPLDAKGKKALFQPTAFCEDADREILALDWNGKIFRLTAP